MLDIDVASMLFTGVMEKTKLPFVFFVMAEALSLFGQAAFMLVLPWLILTVTGSAAHTSTIATIATLPAIAASLASGPIIDRVGRRRASILATLGCALAATGFAVTSTLGIINVAWLIGFGLIANLFLIPSMTARDTLMKDIATTSGLPLGKVAGLRQLVFGVTFLAGPGLAGWLMTQVSPSFVLWLVASLWAVAAVCTRFLPAGAKSAPDNSDNARATFDDLVWRRMLRTPAISLAMVVAFGTALISAPITDVLIPAHFRALNEPQLFGWAMAIMAAGTLVGGTLYMVLARFARLTYVTAVLLLTVSLGILALLPSFWPLAGGLLLMGISSSMATPFLMVAITTYTKDAERGRVMSVYNTLSMGATPIGLGLLAILLSQATLQAGFVAALGIWLVVAVVMLIGGKKLYTIEQHGPTAAHH